MIFLARYRKGSKEILIKLRPYGGKKKHTKEIRSLHNKVNQEELIIEKWVGKFERKNEELVKIEEEFSRIKVDTKTK